MNFGDKNSLQNIAKREERHQVGKGQEKEKQMCCHSTF